MRDSSPALARVGLAVLKELAGEIGKFQRPPDTGAASLTEKVLPFSIVRETRGYLETITHQLNGSYDNGWFDACSVMMRKLIEALIIEVFEERGMTAKIQTNSGDFLQLEALIGRVIGESTWNLSRTTKRALSDVKGLGDNSAHGRRFAAHRGDIDNLKVGFRTAVQELVHLAGLA